MAKLLDILNKKLTSKLEIIRALRDEFINRGYKPSRETASDFKDELEKEYPSINRWVSRACDGRDIEDIIMDEFRIHDLGT